jgi:predicted enzyme related to lactoylglutathione lyase
MTARTEYAPGTPNWVDLATTDVAGAKAFYGGLFGWAFHDEATDQGSDYTMCLRNGVPVAGMMPQSPDMAAAGLPSLWTSYVSVTDVDATLEAVAAAGGSVMMPAMTVMEAGRMAMIGDPTGAVIALWEKNRHVGAGLVNEHGAFTWNELQTSDVDVATAFYATVFGWEPAAHDMGHMVYTEFLLAGSGVAGAMPLPVEGVPPYWAVYFGHDAVDEAVVTATELGGSVVLEPMDGPPGRWAFIADPQGGVFAAMTLAGRG